MLWVILSLSVAFLKSVEDVFSKRLLKEFSEHHVAWMIRAFTFLLILPVVLWKGIPTLGPSFWWAITLASLLNVVATVCYLKAIKYADLSLVAPLSSFTPLFLIITSPLILHEFPGLNGIIGILLIVAGSYLLNINTTKKGMFAPFSALLSNRGVRYMLFAAFVWSITSNMDKIGTTNSDPLFWVLAVNFASMILLLPWVYKKIHISHAARFLPVGIVSACMLGLQMTAIQFALVSYVIALKRTSGIFSIFFGSYLFGELHLKKYLLGASVMLAGVLCITLFR